MTFSWAVVYETDARALLNEALCVPDSQRLRDCSVNRCNVKGAWHEFEPHSAPIWTGRVSETRRSNWISQRVSITTTLSLNVLKVRIARAESDSTSSPHCVVGKKIRNATACLGSSYKKNIHVKTLSYFGNQQTIDPNAHWQRSWGTLLLDCCIFKAAF